MTRILLVQQLANPRAPYKILKNFLKTIEGGVPEALEGVVPEALEGSTPEVSPKPTLLLHACCGPCSSYVLELLAQHFQITIYYYNPNIYPETEYTRRLEELKAFLPRYIPATQNNVKLEVAHYDPNEFYAALGVKEEPELAKQPEKGERCRRCYKMRMSRAYEYACQNHFDYFCTTLSISPFKDADKINQIGRELEAQGVAFKPGHPIQTVADGKSPKWLLSDFKKEGGFDRSLELTSEYGMYRQEYCGCIYSSQNVEMRLPRGEGHLGVVATSSKCK